MTAPADTGSDPLDDSDGDTPDESAGDPAVYDHLRPTNADVAPGVYRIVGTGDPVTLLRVGNADGRRVNTGQVVSVELEALAGFEPADNPDGNRPATAAVAGALDSLVWQVRAFGRGLRARPVASLVGVSLVVAGQLDGRVPGPDWMPVVLALAGALALAYAGSRGD